MLKVIISLLVIFSMTQCVFAAPIYGPELPEKHEFHIGGQTHYVNEKELQGDHGQMQSLQHFMLVSFGVTEWFSLDFKGGAGDVHIDGEDGSTLKYPAYMAGGYGFRIKLYEKKKSKVIVGFQHISVHPYSIWIGNTKHKAVLDDWQWSVLGSYEFSGINPYLGVKWATMDYIHWEDGERNLIKSEENKRIGCVVGANVPLSDKWWFNVEAHLIDTEAASFSLLYRF